MLLSALCYNVWCLITSPQSNPTSTVEFLLSGYQPLNHINHTSAAASAVLSDSSVVDCAGPTLGPGVAADRLAVAANGLQSTFTCSYTY